MNDDPFDWSLARAFLGALDHGSLMAAARALGTSQPTLGRHIAELEQQLGLVLFERTARGLVPTPAARQLVGPARAMAHGAQALRRAASGRQGGLAGVVRLAASQTVACVLLPPVLVRMRAALPDIEISIVVSNELTDLLRRDADIALRMVRPQQASLVARRLGSIAIGACAHRDYLARRGTPGSVADLAHHDLIATDRSGDLERGAAAAGLDLGSLRFALRTDDLIAQWAAVRIGLGIGFVADFVQRSDPDVVPVLPGLPLPQFPLWLAVHREIRTSARIRAVYDALGTAIGAALAA